MARTACRMVADQYFDEQPSAEKQSLKGPEDTTGYERSKSKVIKSGARIC